MTLDSRLNAFRDDLADKRLAAVVSVPHYAIGTSAWISVGCAPVRRMPEDRASCETFYHYGEQICIFERGERYSWCQSSFDGYVGYVQNEHVNTNAHDGSEHYVATMGSYAYAVPDMKHPAVDFLPRHARVRVVESDIMTRGTAYVLLEDGKYVPASCVSALQPRSNDFMSALEKYLGCPYLWGGRSFLGIDCSGLIQSALLDIGKVVLRDTDMQQETIGTSISAKTEADIRRGDILFRPGHVAVYNGAAHVIHADGGMMIVRQQMLTEFLEIRHTGLSDMHTRRI